ncbi:MAG: MFS transporter [Oligoflexia bacterium]|nr:MFS transporter [Oligoflexia bacterium]
MNITKKNQNQHPAASTPRTTISIKEKIGYGLGDTASNFYWQMFMSFILFFYTDVFGISAAAAGTLLLVTRIWDTGIDPLMGIMADRTDTRWGKFRPYLIWMAIPIGIIGVLAFTTPDLSTTGKIIYAYVTLTLLMAAYSAINTPYSALMGVLTSNSLERTSISSYRFVLAFVAAFIVQGTTLPLVQFFGKGNQAIGFQWTMAVFSLAAVVLFFVTFLTTKERIRPPVNQKTSLKNDVSDLMHNRPWMVLFFIGIFVLSYNSIRSGSIIYYFKYYVGNTDLTSTFMMSGTVAVIIGVMTTKYLSKIWGKKKLYMSLMGIVSILTSAFYFIPKENIALIFALHVIISLLLAPTAPLIWAMYADTADYSEWKFGRRATGLIFSAATFAQKFGWAIGGAITGWLLAYYGFVANTAQAEGTQDGIRLMMSIIPAAGSILATLTIAFYNLDEPLMEKIEKELLRRKENDSRNTPDGKRDNSDESTSHSDDTKPRININGSNEQLA